MNGKKDASDYCASFARHVMQLMLDASKVQESTLIHTLVRQKALEKAGKVDPGQTDRILVGFWQTMWGEALAAAEDRRTELIKQLMKCRDQTRHRSSKRSSSSSSKKKKSVEKDPLVEKLQHAQRERKRSVKSHRAKGDDDHDDDDGDAKAMLQSILHPKGRRRPRKPIVDAPIHDESNIDGVAVNADGYAVNSESLDDKTDDHDREEDENAQVDPETAEDRAFVVDDEDDDDEDDKDSIPLMSDIEDDEPMKTQSSRDTKHVKTTVAQTVVDDDDPVVDAPVKASAPVKKRHAKKRTGKRMTNIDRIRQREREQDGSEFADMLKTTDPPPPPPRSNDEDADDDDDDEKDEASGYRKSFCVDTRRTGSSSKSKSASTASSASTTAAASATMSIDDLLFMESP